MRVRNAILAALLAAAGIAVFADDAKAIGRKKKAAASCGSCAAPAMAAPCGGCGGGVAMIGSANPNGNVIVSSDAIPAPLPRDTTTSAVTGTGSNAFAIPSTNVIPATYAGPNPGMVVPAGYAVPVAPARRGLFRR